MNFPATSDPAHAGGVSNSRADAASVVRRLRSEHPQIIAAVLVRLDVALAADTLRLFSDELRNHIILRIATLNPIRPAAMKDLHDVLLFVLSAPQTSSQPAFGGIAAAGKIIGQLGSGIEATVLASIRDHDPDLAGAITNRLAASEKRVGATSRTGDFAKRVDRAQSAEGADDAEDFEIRWGETGDSHGAGRSRQGAAS